MLLINVTNITEDKEVEAEAEVEVEREIGIIQTMVEITVGKIAVIFIKIRTVVVIGTKIQVISTGTETIINKIITIYRATQAGVILTQIITNGVTIILEETRV